MELNFKEKFSHCYDGKKIKTSKQFSSSNSNQSIQNTNKHNTSNTSDEHIDKSFHLDCKYTRKKVCFCKFSDNSQCLESEMEFSNFLNYLINDEITLDMNSSDRKIKFLKKDKYSDFNKQKCFLEEERLRNIDYNKAKVFLKNNEELNLSISDYKEIEKSINDDKKICENCKTNIYENNFHKGWKNEAGEYVLLCPFCSKKYFNGALEIKFDRNDVIINKAMQTSNSNHIIIKNDVTASTKINFQVINTSRPVEDPTLLGNKRYGEREPTELICSNKRCLKIGKRNDFINCSNCDKYYHPNCVEPQVVLKYVNRFKWYCPSCKICQVCNKVEKKVDRSDKKETLTRCGTCDRTFHHSCYNLTESSMNRKAFCVDCINCKNCNKVLPLLNAMNQYDFLSIKGYRVCDECWNYYKTVFKLFNFRNITVRNA